MFSRWIEQAQQLPGLAFVRSKLVLPGSIGLKVVWLVSVVVVLSSAISGGIATIFAMRIVQDQDIQLSAKHLDVLTAKFDEITEYVSRLPSAMSETLQFHDFLIDYFEADMSDEAIQRNVRQFEDYLEHQVLSLNALEEISLLSSTLGGREILKIRWKDGEPTSVETDTLTTAPSIPFFLRSIRRGDQPTFRMPTSQGKATNAEHFSLTVAQSLQAPSGLDLGVITVSSDISDWLINSFKPISNDQVIFIANIKGQILFLADRNGAQLFPGLTLAEFWPKPLDLNKGGLDKIPTYYHKDFHLAMRSFSLDDDDQSYVDNPYIIGLQFPSENHAIYQNASLYILTGLSTFAVAIMAAIAVMFLLRPIRRLAELAMDIAAGRKDVNALENAHSTTETRIMASALEQLRNSLGRRTEKLKDSMVRLRIATSAAGIGIWKFDRDKNANRYWSNEIYNLLGYDYNDPKVAPSLHKHMEPELAKQFLQDVENSFETKTRLHIETKIMCRDGSARWISVYGQPRFEQGNTSAHMIGTVQDIHDLKMAENIKSEFVSVISHELRTPMTSIIGSLTLIASKKFGDVPAQVMRLVGIAESNSKRLLRLINEILDLEKMLKNQTKLNKICFSAKSLVNLVTSQNAQFCEDQQVKLVIAGEIPDAIMLADFDRLVQVLTNLISNAAKFSPDGTKVSVSVGTDSEYVTFTISDEGPGISEEQQEAIFQPFVQLDSSDTRSQGGTGLGLTIAKSIVTLHGGEIWLNSNDKGTQFCFSIPRTVSNIITSEGTNELDAGRKILFLENDADLAVLLKEYLADDVVLLHACDVETAFDYFRSTRIDQYIIDLHLPGNRGERLIEKLIKNGVPASDIIIYSASLDAEYSYPDAITVFTKSAVTLHDLADYLNGSPQLQIAHQGDSEVKKGKNE